MKNRYDALDGIRTFCCIGIVAMHVLANGQYNVKGFLFDEIIPSMTNFVFLFMTISGFGMCCGYYDKFANRNIDIVSFYSKRYKKLLPFFAMLCVIEALLSSSVSALYETFANLTLCFGLIPNANITVIGVGWFLGVVFIFYLMFPFFCFLISDKKLAWGALIVSYIMNYLCIIYFNANRKSIVYSFVYFMIGGIIYLYRYGLAEIPYIKYISFLGLLATITAFYVLDASTISMLAINTFALVFAISLDGTNVLNNRFTKFFGGISFEIYLCHMLIYRILEKLNLIRLTSNECANYFFTFFITMFGASMFAYIGKNSLDFFISKGEKLINGRKET